jgi:[ribosomal protein S18]-alanine N-acetyltransferase
MPMEVRPLTRDDARLIASWRYPGRFATYDVREMVALSPEYAAVESDGELIGYCCFGAPARVAGVEPEAGILDVGYGLKPELLGGGRGREFVGAILAFARSEFPGSRPRLLILDWNERSRRLATVLGFTTERVVRNREGAFLVMVGPLERARP